MPDRLKLSRSQILAYRRRASFLDQRLARGRSSLQKAAQAGLQDSMPRAALLSAHARVEGATPSTWEQPPLVQVWGPRFSVFVIAEKDLPLFTLARMPDSGKIRQRAEDLAKRLQDLLGDRTMTDREAGTSLGVSANALRYATLTGTVVIRWAGAGAPTIRTAPPPTIEPEAARRQLALRYLHVFGPTTADSFAAWAGIRLQRARETFASLHRSLVAVTTPIGDAWILSSDEEALRSRRSPAAPARLLPSGDTYYLLWGEDRRLLVPEKRFRGKLWTSRVWPGAVMVRGGVVGTWRRDGARVSIELWHPISKAGRAAVADEAEALPLRDGAVSVEWRG